MMITIHAQGAERKRLVKTISDCHNNVTFL